MSGCSTNRALTTLPPALPESIGQLQALKELYLSYNELAGEHSRVVPMVRPTPHALVPAALPSTIGNLKALTKLLLRSNRLTGEHSRSTNHALTTLPAVLPESIGQLQALTKLRLDYNKLTGEYSRSTNRASYPADTVACSGARLDWRAPGA